VRTVMERWGLSTRSGRPEEEATAGGRPPAEGGHATGDVSRSRLAALCGPRGSCSRGLAVGGCGREEGKARLDLRARAGWVEPGWLMLDQWV
jgi:hypothetical protein